MEAKTIQKYKKRSIPWLKKKAIETFNRWIRERDMKGEPGSEYFICSACHKRKSKHLCQAGHYYSAGEYPRLRFNEQNVNAECIQCNYYSGDHLIGYAETIKEKWGVDALDTLDRIAKDKTPFKWDRFSLIEIIEKYKPKPPKKFVL